MRDIDYIKNFKNGDKNSFNTIYNIYYKKVYYLCFSILKHKDDSLDATQEVFIQLYKSINKLKNIDNFNSWINKITISKCINIIKKNKRIVPIENDCLIEKISKENFSITPEEIVINSYKSSYICQLINKLSYKKRIVMILFYYKNIKIKEIANILNCSSGTIKSRLNSARNCIKKYIKKDSTIIGTIFFYIFCIKLI